ncbi:hypothetical protein JCM10550A_10530 [Methanogenium cariaci]
MNEHTNFTQSRSNTGRIAAREFMAPHDISIYEIVKIRQHRRNMTTENTRQTYKKGCQNNFHPSEKN